MTAPGTPPPTPLTPVRESAIAILQRLTLAGHTAYFAGGCVRDRLLGIDPTDYDIATSAKPDDVRTLFPKMQTVGEAFGVMLVRKGAHVIQVATFRTDGQYFDHRHPASVTFSDARHDALRRDFTINGLFEDPLTDTIIDFVAGQADLAARLIRAIGDPLARLNEDHLRMLRAVRFASRFSFAIESETAAAISSASACLQGISRERIGQEIKRMLTDSNRHVAAWELQYLGLDAVVLNEPASLNAPKILARLPHDAPYSTALAAWLLDRHPACPDFGPAIERWSTSLMLSNEEQAGLSDALAIYSILVSQWAHLGVARQKRLAASPTFFQALGLLKAIDLQAFVDCRRRVQELANAGGLAPDPLLTGTDLISHGFTPGPIFKTILDAVYDAQLEGSIASFDSALQLAHAVAAQAGDTAPPFHP